ncbi:MAG: DUF4157 domain-containing protein [Proteobacteria bacterium]|nr:DUF4157 domain-containing protein [Pseudomonadota bacterium]
MKRDYRMEPSYRLGEEFEEELEQPVARTISPGKRTLTMSLQTLPDPIATTTHRARPAAAPRSSRPAIARSFLDYWTEAAVRPDLVAGGIQAGSPGTDTTHEAGQPLPQEEAGQPLPQEEAGQPLPQEVEESMSSAFGVDFSAVRVHEGPRASAIHAQAFTSGADIHFAPGHYDPHGARGRELLAHELAHVVQQAQGRASASVQARGLALACDPSLENEADVMAARAVRGERADGGGRMAPESRVSHLAIAPRTSAAHVVQRCIDRAPHDYFDALPTTDRHSEEVMLAHVKRYAFEDKINDKGQTFQEVMSEAMQRAPNDRDRLHQQWQELLQCLRVGDPKKCQDILCTIAHFVNQLYAAPGCLLDSTDPRMGYQEKGKLSTIDIMPHDFLASYKDPHEAMSGVHAYAFSKTLNKRGQTLQEIVYEAMRRAPRHCEIVRKQWQAFLDDLARKDAKACGDTLSTLARSIQQVYTVPQNLHPLDMAYGQSVIPEFQNDMEARYGSGNTRVNSLDPKDDVYEVYTLDITTKITGKNTIELDKGDVRRIERRNHVLFRDMTKRRFDFIFVILPRRPSPAVLRKLVRFRGKDYRIDLIGGSFVKSGRALGIEVGAAEVFNQLLGYEESVMYALRALFPQVVGGVKGTIRGRAYPIDGETDPEGKALTFTLRDDKTQVQLNDGWGYVKSGLAELMQARGLTRDKRQPKPNSGNANYQMMQWFDSVDLWVIEELAGGGVAQWHSLTRDAEDLQQRLCSAKEKDERFAIQRALQENLEKRYSVLTTGRPPVETAVAMPVSGKNLVLPARSERFQDAPGGASLLRSPADKPNWRPIPAENVEHGSDRSKLLAGMEAIQYTWTGLQERLLTFFKGMLGVIPDQQWPEAWDGVDIVVTGEDRKLYEQWHSEEEREETRSQSEDFSIQGNLVATQWFAPGSIVGVPNDVQKWLGGDYDGDEVNILLKRRNPALHGQIQNEYRDEQVNPKLPKSFTNNPHGDRAGRLVAMRSTNVTDWSSIAARLRGMTPENRQAIATRLRKDNILSPEELDNLDGEAAMWLEVGKGIKVGTDGYKTSVPVETYEARARDYQIVLRDVNLYPLPWEKSLMKTIQKAGPPNLNSGAWRNVYFSCTNDLDTGRGASLWGVPAVTLARMLDDLFPREQLDLKKLDEYYEQWLLEERGYNSSQE